MILALGLAANLAIARLPPSSVDSARIAAWLESKCASCHAEGSEKPKALRAWAGALDLRGTAADPEFVVAGKPDESTLFAVLERGEMPPSKAGVSPVTERELDELRVWIAAGARIESQGGPTATSEQRDGATAGPDWLRWLGRFHPTLVHFPVALWIAALAAEGLWRMRRRPALQAAVDVCMHLGAWSGIPTAVLGWWLAAESSAPPLEIATHRWLGVSVAAAGLGALAWIRARPGSRLLVLAVLAALVSAAGHTGGVLAYGRDWLTPPGWARSN